MIGLKLPYQRNILVEGRDAYVRIRKSKLSGWKSMRRFPIFSVPTPPQAKAQLSQMAFGCPPLLVYGKLVETAFGLPVPRFTSNITLPKSFSWCHKNLLSSVGKNRSRLPPDCRVHLFHPKWSHTYLFPLAHLTKF